MNNLAKIALGLSAIAIIIGIASVAKSKKPKNYPLKHESEVKEEKTAKSTRYRSRRGINKQKESLTEHLRFQAELNKRFPPGHFMRPKKVI